MTSSSEQRAGAWAGIAALLSYFGAAFLPLPDPATLLLGLAFGPLFAISFLGLFAALKTQSDGLLLRVAVVFGIIAGAVVTTLLTIQIGNQMWLEQGLAQASGPAEEEAARVLWRAVNRVQALMDVSWDIFLSVGSVLIGLVMVRHQAFGRVWGWLGVLLALLLLGLNLYTFPSGPAYAGLVDVGPLLALWFGAVFVRIVLRSG
jgi:hypothetical protein